MLLALAAVTTHRCQRVPESVCPQWLSEAMKYPPLHTHTQTHTSTTHSANNTVVAHFFFLHRFKPPHPPFPPSFCFWWLHCCYGDAKPCTLKSALGRRSGEADNNIPLPRLTDMQSLVFVEVIMVALAEKGAVWAGTCPRVCLGGGCSNVHCLCMCKQIVSRKRAPCLEKWSKSVLLSTCCQWFFFHDKCF